MKKLFSKVFATLLIILLLSPNVFVHASVPEEILRFSNTITVNLDANGGTVSRTSQTATPGQQIGTLPIPTRANHVFQGWFNQRTGGSRITATNIAPSGNITLFAQWERAITVTLNANGGTVSRPSQTAFVGQQIGNLPIPTRANHRFLGWFDQQIDGNRITATNIAGNGNITLFARWEVTITLDANGGTVSRASQPAIAGQQIGALPMPTRANHVFQGWFNQRTGGNRITATSAATGNMILFARWNHSITVTLNPNGGTVSRTSQMATPGQQIGTLPIPTRTNHRFMGWFDRQTGGNRVTATNVAGNGNVTLFARWENSITITLNANGGTVSRATQTATLGQQIGTLPMPTRANHRFLGWFDHQTVGNRITAVSMTPVGNTTLFAHWERAITVTLNANGGTVSRTSQMASVGQAIGSLPVPSRANHRFLGWFDQRTGGNRITATNIAGSGNITLFARWEATITLDANGGTVSRTSQTVTLGNQIGALPVPSRANHRFLGWFDQRTGGNRITATNTATGNMTLFARWERTITVTLDANGGTVSRTSQTVTVGQAIGTLPVPTRTNHRFLGWFNQRAGGNRITAANTAGSGNITLFARWEATITLNANGGTVSRASQHAIVGQQIGTLPMPSRTDFRFLGWFNQQTGGNRITAVSIASGNITLFARWESSVAHTFDNARFCSRCGVEFPLVINSIPVSYRWAIGYQRYVRPRPYGAETPLRQMARGERVRVNAWTINAFGNRWYRNTYGNWIFSGYLSATQPAVGTNIVPPKPCWQTNNTAWTYYVSGVLHVGPRFYRHFNARHMALDIQGNTTRVNAIADGIVRSVGEFQGRWITIESTCPRTGRTFFHNYAHLRARYVNVGTRVTAGQQIGTVYGRGTAQNNSASGHRHLHLAIFTGGSHAGFPDTRYRGNTPQNQIHQRYHRFPYDRGYIGWGRIAWCPTRFINNRGLW